MSKVKRIIFLLSILIITKNISAMINIGGNIDVKKGLEELAKSAEKISRELMENARVTHEQKIRNIQFKIDQKETKKSEYLDDLKKSYTDKEQIKKDISQLDKEIVKLNEDLDDARKQKAKSEHMAEEIGFKASSGLVDLGLTFGKNIINEQKEEKDRKSEENKAAITAAEQRKTSIENVKNIIKGITDKDNLLKGGVFLAGTTAAIVTAYYGATLGYNYLESIIGKPTLIRESSRHDWKQNIKSFWNETILGYEPEPEARLSDVVFAPDMAAKLKLLADDTRSTQENGLPYRHVLFYGLPGTGKTLFAKTLAKYSGMDYAIMSGADFSQFSGGLAVQELHKLFDWADHSEAGLLIFVDEADAFLRDRRLLDNEGKNLVNAFLSRTGTSSNKFMLVFASNYEDELDPAALSRINKKIYFPLPDLAERIKIFNLYFKKYVINDSRTVVKDGSEVELNITVSKDIDDEFIRQIGQKIEGFSGREIEQLVGELRIAAYNIGNGTITRAIITKIVDEKVIEHKHDMACAEYQKKRLEKQTGQAQVSMQSSHPGATI